MTATVPASDVLEGLDFDPELPCEHSWHARAHVPGDPAAWIARSCCPACAQGLVYLLCASGLEDLKSSGEVRCRFCDLLCPWYEAVVILGPVRSP